MTERIAIVTGAASGLGWAISRTLASSGFQVAMLDRSTQIADRAAELAACGLKASGFQADLTDPDAIKGFSERHLDQYGRCDVLVNNAGIHFKKDDGHWYRFEEIELSKWNLSLALHMTAPMLLCQAFLPGMKERRWGRVINVASRAGRTYVEHAAAFYAASKAGIIGLTRSIAGQYAPYGVTCNVISPGRFVTPLTERSAEAVKQLALSEIPSGRAGDPMELGQAVRFLASEDAGFITGANIDINGGAFMAP